MPHKKKSRLTTYLTYSSPFQLMHRFSNQPTPPQLKAPSVFLRAAHTSAVVGLNDMKSARGTFDASSLLPHSSTTSSTAQQQYCCIVRLAVVDSQRNVFVNVTSLKGQTVVRFTTHMGSSWASSKARPQPKRSVIRWIIDRVGSAIGGHHDYTKVIVQTRSSEMLLYLKESLRKYWHKRPKIIYYKGLIPIAHNGCRPPKKRRV